MTPEEKIATYRDIIAEAKAEAEKLKKELKELRAKLAPPPPPPGAAAAPVAP